MKRKMFLILLCIAAISMVGIATGTLRKSEKAKATPTTTVYRLRQVRQEKPDPPGTIDGAKNPELISDNVTYSLLFRLISNHQTETEKHRITAYLEQAGLTGSDIDGIIAAANEFSQRVSVLDAHVKRIKDNTWPNPSPAVMAQLTLLQKNKEAIVAEIVASLPSRLTVPGLNSIRLHVNNHMKRRLKLFPGPEHPPEGPGWQKHNMKQM